MASPKSQGCFLHLIPPLIPHVLTACDLSLPPHHHHQQHVLQSVGIVLSSCSGATRQDIFLN
eukprot:3965488-Prorocentrum_lima.AAC.1